MTRSPLLGVFLAVASLAIARDVVCAQSGDSTRVVRGTVHGSDEAPIAGADVFLLESLDGASTDSAGRFSIRTTQHGPATLVARRIGFAPARRVVDLADADSVQVSLIRQ